MISHRMCTPCQMKYDAPALTMDLTDFVRDPIAKKAYRCHYCGEPTISTVKCFRRPGDLANHDCSKLHEEGFEGYE